MREQSPGAALSGLSPDYNFIPSVQLPKKYKIHTFFPDVIAFSNMCSTARYSDEIHRLVVTHLTLKHRAQPIVKSNLTSHRVSSFATLLCD